MKQYTIQGQPFWFLSAYELAKTIKKTTRTIRNWESKGILPKPSVTKPIKTGLGNYNRRLYTEDQAKLIIKWIDRYNLYGRRIMNPECINWLHEEWARIEVIFKAQLKGEKDGSKKDDNREREIKKEN